MASTQDFVDYVCDQAGLPDRLAIKKMFGEYALYVDEKVVALICDNQVFIKVTDPGRDLLGPVTEAAPYPGAKLHFQVSEHVEDGALLRALLIATAATLPAPTPKSAKPSVSKQPSAAAIAAKAGAKIKRSSDA